MNEEKKKWRVGPYEIEAITPTVYAIDTDEDESMYLVIGKEKALMIDTGSNKTPLMPIIQGLYPGPVELALTHAHFDHMYHSDAFSKVYLHQDDINAWKKILGLIVFVSSAASGKKPKHYPVKTYTPLREGDVLSLGDRDLKVILAPGHTPGSILLADEKEKLLFTGDAIGSGNYCWMWMPGCLTLTEYRKTLAHLKEVLAPYRDYIMLGGHRRQGMEEENPDSHPLTMQVIEDMDTLTERILHKDISPVGTERNFGFLTYVYRFGHAGIVLRKNKIK